MKKLLAVLGLSVLLVGCGGSGTPKEESATCTMDLDGAGSMDVKFDAKDDKIYKANMKVMMTTEQLGQDLSGLTDEEKALFENMITSAIGIESGEGITTDSKIDDSGLSVIIDLDFEKADASALSSLGFEENTNLSLKDLLKDAASDGAVCK